MSVSAPAHPAAPVSPRRWLALLVLAAAQLMLVLDVTIVNVALPDIGGSLGLGRGALPWVMTIYTLFFGGLMLLGGRLADLLNPRRTTLAGLVLFLAASLACGLSGDAATLLAGRALQGLAAAVMSPAALAAALTVFDGPDRGRTFGVWSQLAGLGTVLGVVLGGVLTSGPGWRWVFIVNLPVGVVLLVAIPLLVPAATAARGEGDGGLDVPGAALVTAGTGAAIYGLVNAGGNGWLSGPALVPIAAAAVLWGLFALVERRTARPLLSVGLLLRRPVAAGSFLMLVATGLLVGGFFLGSFTLQHAHGLGPARVGVAYLPVAVAIVAGARTAGHVLARVTARTVAVTGLALSAAGFAVAAWSTGTVGVVAGLTVSALGLGATFVTAFTASLADATPAEAGLRSALVNTFHELGGAAGVAVLSSVAGSALVAPDVLPGDFTGAFATGAVCAVVALGVAAVLVPAVRRSAPDGHGH